MVELLSNLAGETNNIFDTKSNDFVMLDYLELMKLGVGRHLRYVHADDNAIALRRSQHEVIQQQMHSSDYGLNYEENHEVYQQATHPTNHGALCVAMASGNQRGLFI